MPRGSVLGSTLFLIFINDITDINNTIHNVTMKLFDDDVKLYACSDSSYNLQRAIDKLIDWSDTWQMRLASEKCCLCQVYRRSEKRHETHQYLIKDQNLEHVPLTRDLGLLHLYQNNHTKSPHKLTS